MVFTHLDVRLGYAKHHPSARLIMFLENALEFSESFLVLGLWPMISGSEEAHGDTGVERAEPDGIDVLDLREYGVEVVDAFHGLDLDHDSRLVVQVFVDCFLRVDGCIGEAWDEADGGS